MFSINIKTILDTYESTTKNNLFLGANFFIGFDESITMIEHHAKVLSWSITKCNLHRSPLKTNH